MIFCENIVFIISSIIFVLSFFTSVILLKYYDTIPFTKKNIVFYLSHFLVCDLGCGIMVLVSCIINMICTNCTYIYVTLPFPLEFHSDELHSIWSNSNCNGNYSAGILFYFNLYFPFNYYYHQSY